jgi:small-conductance mechanosensitive channel
MERDFSTLWDELFSTNTLYGDILWAVVIGFIAWSVGRASGLMFQRMQQHPKYMPSDRTAIGFLAQFARLCIYMFAFVTWAQLIPALKGIGTAWLASVGVVSVVLGLAAQNTLGNLIAGIALILYRPFNIGDRLQVTAPSGLETGIVESLNLGYTVLRTADNRRIVIPNSAMASQTSVNLSLTDERTICLVPFRLTHEADVDKARKILVDLANQTQRVLEVQSCPMTDLSSTSVTLTLRVWVADPKAATEVKNELLEAGKRKFGEAGVELFRFKGV